MDVDKPLSKNHSSFIESLRTITRDAKAICIDGEIEFIANIVMARCAPIAQMFSGNFSESKDRVIRFPNKRVLVVKKVLDYLQYDDMPEGLVKTGDWLDMYAMSDEYQITELIKYIKGILLEIAKDAAQMVEIYDLCTYSSLEDVKKLAYESIRRTIRHPTAFKCNLCPLTIQSLYCNGGNNRRCHEIDPAKVLSVYKCSSCTTVHGCEFSSDHKNLQGVTCKGKFKPVRIALSYDNASEQTRAQLFELLCADTSN